MLTLSLIMLKNGQTYFKNLFYRFLKYVWPFFNIMKERAFRKVIMLIHCF